MCKSKITCTFHHLHLIIWIHPQIRYMKIQWRWTPNLPYHNNVYNYNFQKIMCSTKGKLGDTAQFWLDQQEYHWKVIRHMRKALGQNSLAHQPLGFEERIGRIWRHPESLLIIIQLHIPQPLNILFIKTYCYFYFTSK